MYRGSPFYTPALGGRFRDWIRFLRRAPERPIAPKYWTRIVVVGLVCFLSTPFQWYESWRLRRKLKAMKLHPEPVFIIGHWRSGTTHLHNLLSLDEQFGHVTTLQGIFPHSYQTNFLYPYLTNVLLPPTRPMDNMKIYLHSPQEEEIALVNSGPYSFYHLWHLPKQMRSWYHYAVKFEGMGPKARQEWKRIYLNLLKRAAVFAGKPRLLLKNPPNTARIPTLLELFPNARFIYIHRDPKEVYGSTKKLHARVMPLFNLQPIESEQVNEDILHVYRDMIRTYLEDRDLIPEDQMVEVAYPDLVNHPMEELERIYQTLKLGEFDRLADTFANYVEAKKGYKKSTYEYTPEEWKAMKEQLQFIDEAWPAD